MEAEGHITIHVHADTSEFDEALRRVEARLLLDELAVSREDEPEKCCDETAADPCCPDPSDLYNSDAPEAKPYRCPVCDGRGGLPPDFYESDMTVTTYMGLRIITLEPVTCRACDGEGVVWGG